MVVKNILKALCRQRGIENPYQLKAETGLPYSTCLSVWKESHIPSKSVMNDICRTLKIQPGDFLVYEEEN